MLSALLRPFKGSDAHKHADLERDLVSRTSPSAAEYHRHLHATADFTEADDDDDESNDGEQSRYLGGGRPEADEDGPTQSAGLLPLFSTSSLDSLPIYSITHAIRIVVQARTETTLTWEQLKSPQVSQFLIKPMQQQIRSQNFSLGTLYALLANCLQFEKEAQLHSGNAGTSGTRARICELLAIKLLKEYNTRELIDALCYDFYPLQGIPGSQTPLAPGGRPKPAALRTSTLEVAIRASAKHFLSETLVVRQLEAIWNGAISFYPVPEEPQHQASAAAAAGGSQSRRQSTVRTPLLSDQQPKEEIVRPQSSLPDRRSVVLYDPRTASLFKLSRLRVPRYRRILSTCSLVILISLLLTVLSQRSSRITTVELLFWFWSAGFMLDEIVGLNEQGFSFYVMSFWNIFDLGILLLLIIYYCMRIYGVFLVDPHKWNENAYDVLAINAVLLLPRVFDVLEHCRYFSQLLMALRLLAIDLAAVFLLILTLSSGFFVFFAFSKNSDDPYELAYKVFQILMGFTPAAWEMWSSYGWIWKTLMGSFLVISHFVVVAILVAVLTNSFMSIKSRANQEYRFLFAINTISMVRNNVLFSYVAPGNIFAWALMPLRHFMSRTRFVCLNRAVIKATHFPLLFCIYFYEKYFLAADMYEATDLVDNPGRGHQLVVPFAGSLSRLAFFSPGVRVREESVFGYQKDRALEEVFRRAPDMRTQRRNERRKTQTAIRTWMDQHDGDFNSPRNYSTIDSRIGSDWYRRLSMARERPSRFPRHYSDIRSTASDPADLISDAAYPTASAAYKDGIARRDYAAPEAKDNTDGDADGDDELVTNDEDEEDNVTNNMDDSRLAGEEAIEEDYFTTPVATRFGNAELSSADSPNPPATSRRAVLHNRTLSTNTILYVPEDASRPYSSSSASGWPSHHALSRPISTRYTPVATPITRGDGRRSPRRSLYLASRPRSMVQTGDELARTAPNRTILALDIPSTAVAHHPAKATTRRRSLADLATSADDPVSAHPGEDDDDDDDHRNDINKLMLARMKSLEASLGDVVREMRTLRKSVPNTAHNSDEGRNGSGGGGGGDDDEAARTWGGRRAHPQPRVFPGSDPSSTSGALPLIEVAVGGRERGGAAGAAPRRARAMTTTNTPPRRMPGRRAAAAAGGIWRSPREGRGEGPGGLGIKVGSEGSSRLAKGKEKERMAGAVGLGDSPALSPETEVLEGFAKGTSL